MSPNCTAPPFWRMVNKDPCLGLLEVAVGYQAKISIAPHSDRLITGKLRPRGDDELQPLADAITAALEGVRGTFCLNVKRLGRLNN